MTFVRRIPVTIDTEGLEFLRRYASWPAWRRWVWRNLGR